MNTTTKPKIVRMTTIPGSMRGMTGGQFAFMRQFYEIIPVAAADKCFAEVMSEQGIKRYYAIDMTRQITLTHDIKAVAQLVKILKKEKPDIVHTQTPKAGIVGMMAAWLAGVPIRMHTITGLPLLVETGFRRFVLNWVERFTNLFATNVYPNSKAMMKIMVDNRLVSGKKVKVLANGSSNGINTKRFSPEADFPRLQKNDDVFTFVFVGRIVKDKGINELAHAFQRLTEVNKNIKLILVGAYEDNLDPISNESREIINNNPQIEAVGGQRDVRPYYAMADVLVFPSYREGFPNVVMEAGAMGLPSIVTDINGCNEIIIPGKNGEIIPPQNEDALYNKMKEWIDNPDKVKSMAQNAREMITSRFEQQAVWDALHAEYDSLLVKKKR